MCPPGSSKRLLGRILLDGALVTPAELERALTEQQKTGELLGQVLIRLDILDETQVRAALAVQEHLGTLETALNTAAGARDMLGLLLQRAGYLSEEQLEAALALQKATGEKIGSILVRIGVINPAQLDSLLKFQENQGKAGAIASPLQIGQLLVTTGAITRTQLADALEIQKKSSNRLGDILVAKGLLTSRQLDRSLNLQQKLVAASLVAMLSLSLTACGGGGGGSGASKTDSGTTDVVNIADGTSSGLNNYVTLAEDTYGLLPHNFYYSTDNDQFWAVEAIIADSLHDVNALTVFRIHVKKANGAMQQLNKSFSIEDDPILEKFPGDMLIFNGQKSSSKKVVSGTISFTPDSVASDQVKGSFDVIMADYDAAAITPPSYRIKGYFQFRIGTYGPAPAKAVQSGSVQSGKTAVEHHGV